MTDLSPREICHYYGSRPEKNKVNTSKPYTRRFDNREHLGCTGWRDHYFLRSIHGGHFRCFNCGDFCHFYRYPNQGELAAFFDNQNRKA